MTRRGKIVLAVLVVGSVLGLVAATNAWFIAVSNTPPGAINSALVRWLPEAGERSFTSLLTYGNVISGSGVDPDGVPLVLPGNSLLANSTVEENGDITVRTSIARVFEEKETVDTVIHWEIREVDGAEVTRKQRDLMDARDPRETWWKDNVELGANDKPTPIPSQYDIVTTTKEDVVKDDAAKTTTTTTVVTTTYTPRPEAGDIPFYKQEITTVKIITREGATYSPKTYTDTIWDALPSPTEYLKATETVLFVQASLTVERPNPAKQPTRSYLIIEHIGAKATTTNPKTVPVPLALGNLSTTESQVRVGLNGRLTTLGTDGTASSLALTIRTGADGSCYLGTTAEGKFVELIEFSPYRNTGYSWVRVAEKEPQKALWGLWDLKVGTLTAVPAPSPASAASAPPSTSLAPEPTPEPYIVTNTLRIVSKRPADSAITANTAEAANAEFERLFNLLYCENVPTITLHLSYYTRQSEFMSWNEFYSQDIDMSVYS